MVIPFALQCIDHLVLRVRSLEASIAFYERVLGCRVVKRRPDLGLVHLRAGESMIDLIAIDGQLGRDGGAAPGSAGRNLDHLCLRVAPFDESALLAHLSQCGVVPSGPATVNFGAAGDGPSLYIRDPDGNVVEIKGYDDYVAKQLPQQEGPA